ncbi:MAG: LytTR family DNA-binding domain-containing protein, partial [Bacteroidales bacterium]|nr:LytTR family DNA-binding domain-containing protein [Bacteroidales bacterium]
NMEKIKAIIVDDEPDARDIIASLLSDFSDVEVLSKEESVDKALTTVRRLKPDLIFLDIDMPKKNGFELVKELRDYNLNPTIIFITAYNQYAIEAIKHAAFDYLVKPVDIDDLKQSIERYQVERKSVASLDRIENLLQAFQEEKLKFSTRTGSVFINPAEIIYCQADHNYTDLFMTNEKKQTVTISVGRLEQILPQTKFSKINRSVIINKQFLTEINRKDKKCILRVNDEDISFCMPAKYISELDN